MSDQEQPQNEEQAQAGASKEININLVELVNIGAKILDQMFFKAPKDKAKPVYKELKGGKQLPVGSITFQKTLESNVSLALDYSEFVGPGFNFDVFLAALQGILMQIATQFKKKGDLNVLTSEQGGVLIHLPGAVKIDDQYNVMVLSFEMGDIQNILIRLMFVDPSQYDAALRDQQAGEEA